jgi:hypothetical protein
VLSVLEIANSIEPAQDGRIFIELVNGAPLVPSGVLGTVAVKEGYL